MERDKRAWMERRGFKPVINPFGGGYTPGFDPGQMYEYMHEYWDKPNRFRLSDQHPMFNVAGLWWRQSK